MVCINTSCTSCILASNAVIMEISSCFLIHFFYNDVSFQHKILYHNFLLIILKAFTNSNIAADLIHYSLSLSSVIHLCKINMSYAIKYEEIIEFIDFFTCLICY